MVLKDRFVRPVLRLPRPTDATDNYEKTAALYELQLKQTLDSYERRISEMENISAKARKERAGK